MDARPPEQQQRAREERRPDVGQEMVGKEVDVDRHGQHHDRPERREGGQRDPVEPDRPRDVGAERGIHEPGEERHAHQLDHARLGVGPAARAHLEPLHGRAGQVEQQDHPRLLPRLQLAGEHQRLRGHGKDHQRVVPGKRPVVLPDRAGDEDRGKDQHAEQPGPELLSRKAQHGGQGAAASGRLAGCAMRGVGHAWIAGRGLCPLRPAADPRSIFGKMMRTRRLP